jgi:hypothetical protein
MKRLMRFPEGVLAWKGSWAVKASHGRSQLVKALAKPLNSKTYLNKY